MKKAVMLINDTTYAFKLRGAIIEKLVSDCLLYTSRRSNLRQGRRIPRARPLHEGRSDLISVSYTHLDVYKRQDIRKASYMRPKVM